MTARILKMPRLGETMDEGKIVGWLVQPGDSFKRGDPIVEIETDKTIAEFPALGDGRFDGIIAEIGETVDVGAPIAHIDIGSGPDWTAEEGDESLAVETAPALGDITTHASEPVALPHHAADGSVRATPVARRLARQRGLDIATLAGTGRRGRIEKEDVLAKLGIQSPAPTTTANAGQVPAETLFADLSRGRMAYLDSGTGPTVLLLHGFAGDRTAFAAVAAGLKRAGRRVLVPDLPGHGLTEISARDEHDLSADLPALLDRVAAGSPVDIIAHSLGAVAALDLAARVPERIGSISLLAPAGLGPDIDGDFLRGMARATVSGEVSHLLRRISINPPALSEAALAALATEMKRGRLADLVEAVVGPSGQRLDRLARLEDMARRLPVRVIFGLEDRIIPWHQVTSVSPRVAIHLLARAGHMPHWDQTGDVLAILLADRG